MKLRDLVPNSYIYVSMRIIHSRGIKTSLDYWKCFARNILFQKARVLYKDLFTTCTVCTAITLCTASTMCGQILCVLQALCTANLKKKHFLKDVGRKLYFFIKVERLFSFLSLTFEPASTHLRLNA
jgi:hypothetical protein